MYPLYSLSPKFLQAAKLSKILHMECTEVLVLLLRTILHQLVAISDCHCFIRRHLAGQFCDVSHTADWYYVNESL